MQLHSRLVYLQQAELPQPEDRPPNRKALIASFHRTSKSFEKYGPTRAHARPSPKHTGRTYSRPIRNLRASALILFPLLFQLREKNRRTASAERFQRRQGRNQPIRGYLQNSRLSSHT